MTAAGKTNYHSHYTPLLCLFLWRRHSATVPSHRKHDSRQSGKWSCIAVPDCEPGALEINARSSSLLKSGELRRRVRRGALSCVLFMEPSRRRRGKSNDKTGARPTHLSETCSPTSRSWFFGAKTPRRTSRPRADAVCARLKGFSADIASGRATRSPRSWPKFSSVAVCGMSA